MTTDDNTHTESSQSRSRAVAVLRVVVVLLLALATWLALRGGGESPEPAPSIESGPSEVARVDLPPKRVDPLGDPEAGQRDEDLAELLVHVRGPLGINVPRAMVTLWAGIPRHELDRGRGEPTRLTSVSTDLGGIARVRGATPNEDVTLIVDSAKYATAYRHVTTPGPGQTRRVEILVSAEHALRGTVLSTDGSPIEGATVQVARGWPWQATSGVDGCYELASLPWGRHEIRAGRAGHRPLRVANVVLPLAGAFDIVLDEPAVLEGVVTDAATGAPLAGAKVVAGIWWGMRGGGEAETDADGRYRIDTLPEGTVNNVLVSIAGYRNPPRPPGPTGLQIGVTAGSTARHDVAMQRDAAADDTGDSASIAGTVSGPDGPLDGIEVTATSRSGRHHAMTAEDGRYTFPQLRSGSWQVYVEPLGSGLFDPAYVRGAREHDWSHTKVELTPGQAAEHDIALSAGSAIVGRIIAPYGTPVPGARFGSAAADDEGRFRLAGVAPGLRTEWYVTADGFVTTTVPVTAPVAGDSDEIVVTLQPFARVTGSLTAALTTDYPADAFVRVVAYTGRVLPGPGAREDVRTSEPAAVWDDWTYAADLPWTESGEFVVEVHMSGRPTSRSERVSIERGLDLYSIDLVLRPVVEITGRVLDDATGDPVAGATIAVGTQIDHVSAVTLPSGEFTVRGDGSAQRVAVHVRARGYMTWNGSVDPRSSDAVDVRLLRTGEIRGRVEAEDGSPLAGIRVVRSNTKYPAVITDHDGNFVLRDLPLEATGLDLAPASAAGPDVRATTISGIEPGIADLTITMSPGLRIAGRVVLPNGAGVADAVVQAVADGDAPSAAAARAQTSGSGEFVLTGLAPGAYDLIAQANTDSPYAREAAGTFPARAVGVSAGTDNLELRLSYGESIRGIVVDEDGNPAPSMWIGTGGRTAHTATDGTFEIEGLPPGRYDIRAAPSSMSGEFSEITGGEGVAAGATGVRLTALRGVELTGRVVDDGGNGVADATITLTASPRTRRTARSDADGAFRFANLPRGKVTLVATSPGFVGAEVENVALGEPVALQLSRGISASGRITDPGGAPVAERWVDFVVEGADYLRREARTDADGRFEVDGLVEREYRVVVLMRVDGELRRMDAGTIRGGAVDVALDVHSEGR